MNYYLFKLRFSTAVHFGFSDSALSLYTSDDHFCGDTLFSALCHTAKSLQGSAGLERLCAWVREDRLRLSDSMPWWGERYYLPKPYVISEHKTEVPARLRKAIKKLRWIELSSFQDFADSVHGGGLYQPRQQEFGIRSEQTKVSLAGQESVPYQVGTWQFYPDCGLYILAGCKDPEVAAWLETLMRGLGLGGIGGKVTAGYGRFSLDRVIDLAGAEDAGLRWLNNALNGKTGGRQMLLTTSLPQDGELEEVMEGAGYQLVRRSGFANTEGYAEGYLKKQTQYYLAAGSVLGRRFRGDLYPVADGADHPVYRYGMPLFLEVAL